MERPHFDVDRHISYWQRCFKSLLPTEYTSTDSSRVLLGFFILSALDILGVGVDNLPPSDVRKLRSWILSCQHPNGGFCGSPNHRYPENYYDVTGQYDIDPANLPATYFAILSLSFVGGLHNVKRIACLRWLKRLQREDGSFGEVLGKDGKVEGGRDMRYCHFASGVRWMLRGDLGPFEKGAYEDIDVDKMVKHIQAGETYEGGIGESSRHESHGMFTREFSIRDVKANNLTAGYTYTAIASLAFLDRLPDLPGHSSFGWKSAEETSKSKETALTNLPETVRWLLSRQLAYSDEDEQEDGGLASLLIKSGQEQQEEPSLASLSLSEALCIGFNGRANKLADTCYCFLVSASLEILGHGKLIDSESARRFLLDQTQHRIGGFGKQPGYPPDLYHSYLGLATLAMMKEPGVKEVDPVLCASTETKEKMEKTIKAAVVPWKTYWKHGEQFESPEADPKHAQKIVEDEGPPKFMMDILNTINEQKGLVKVDSKPVATAASTWPER